MPSSSSSAKKRKATSSSSTTSTPGSTDVSLSKKRKKGEKEQPVGVRDLGDIQCKRGRAITEGFDGMIQILYNQKIILEVKYNPVLDNQVTNQHAVTLSVKYNYSKFPLLVYFDQLYDYMLSTHGTICFPWKESFLDKLLEEEENADMKLTLEAVDSASRLWLHYMFLRLYEENTKTQPYNPFHEHEQVYFTYALLLSEDNSNKADTSEDPLVVHLAHTLYKRMGNSKDSKWAAQRAIHSWVHHAETLTKISDKDGKGVIEAAYYQSLITSFNSLNETVSQGKATKILQDPAAPDNLQPEVTTVSQPNRSPSTPCICHSCTIKEQSKFNDLREVYRAIRLQKCYSSHNLVKTSHPRIISGVKEYGALGMHYLQLLAENHSLGNSCLPPSFLRILTFMGQWIQCQRPTTEVCPPPAKIEEDEEPSSDPDSEATVEPPPNRTVVSMVSSDDEDDNAPITKDIPQKKSTSTSSVSSDSKIPEEVKLTLPGRPPPSIPMPTPSSPQLPKTPVVIRATREALKLQLNLQTSSTESSQPCKDSSTEASKSTTVDTDKDSSAHASLEESTETVVQIPAEAVTAKIPSAPDVPKIPSESSTPAPEPVMLTVQDETSPPKPTFEEASAVIPLLTQPQYDAMLASGSLQKLLK